MKTIIEMAREAGFDDYEQDAMLERFAELVAEQANTRANTSWALMCTKMVEAEREVFEKMCEEFARKWWSLHCADNKHMQTTRKAHDDFCALKAAIRARSQAAA